MVNEFKEYYDLLMEETSYFLYVREEFKDKALSLYFNLVDNFKLIDEHYNATYISNKLKEYLLNYDI